MVFRTGIKMGMCRNTLCFLLAAFALLMYGKDKCER